MKMTRFGFQKCAAEGCRIGLVHPDQYGPFCAEHSWARLTELELERDGLREALEWYGDVENYVARRENAYGQPDTMLKPVTRVSRDAGTRARAALAPTDMKEP